ncbi:protein ACCELERATED CELL DEATH 6-like isoform X1 [Pistacia vera]|uniref:protein ACCELERATED CELL DEATH 6-like isoform X1 n=1 Tax=Pistacia vera TaxID=55513 RepID=UPI0012639BAD|nr:protein ACCELERATED CELL DEATH 6-like isoform X1 [Pistacia vera]
MKLLQRVWDLATSSPDFDKNSCILEVARKQIFVAAKRGNIEFLKILIREYPDLIFQINEKNSSIFQISVKYRHVDIFRLIHEISSVKDLIVPITDEKGNNIFHLAAKLAPLHRLHSVSGVALQMQRELMWFEEVKKLMNPFDAEAENSYRKTPRALFSQEHQKLKDDGEKWMKDTANYCMVVAALITTMVFAAALVVPGGTSDETGTPHFLKKSSFKIFIVSDAISLVLSTCSIGSFLSILTSRYAEEDFLESLPRQLLVGLGTLLLSIAAMMVVFCAAIFILFKDGVAWIPILVAAIGSLPVIFFIIQHVWLLIDVWRSTNGSSSIFKPGKGTLFS